MEVWGILQKAAELFEPRGQIASVTGSAEELLRVSKSVSTGTAAASQMVLRVIQACIPWQGHWRRHLQFIALKVQGNSVRLAAT